MFGAKWRGRVDVAAVGATGSSGGGAFLVGHDGFAVVLGGRRRVPLEGIGQSQDVAFIVSLRILLLLMIALLLSLMLLWLLWLLLLLLSTHELAVLMLLLL